MLMSPREARPRPARLPRRRAPRPAPVFLALLAFLLAAPALSQPAAAAARFTLETDHFYVHFDEGYEALAREAAAVAEQVHRELAPRVGHVPSEKTHLILLDATDMANGYTDPMLYPKVVVFPVYPTFFSPYGSGISPRLHQWMRFVILHEYAHALHLDMNEGVGKALATLFGRVPLLTTPMLDESYAFIEGFATYQETIADLGGRGRDPYYAMFLRAMVLDDDVLRLDQILGHYPLERWKPGANVYLYGYALWESMADRYGDDVLERFNRVFARTRSLDATFKEVLGTTPERFYQDWEARLTRTYRAQILELQAEGTTPAQPLGGRGYVPESPVASPDGRRVAYVTVNGPVAPALRLLELRPGAPRDRQLLAGVPLGPVAWSPDGKTLYYARVDVEDGRTLTDLYAYDLSTGREQRLTRGLRAFGPAPSPDGRRLVFTSRDALATRLLELDLVASPPAGPDSPALREVAPAEGERQLLASGWAPDGSWILVTSHETGGGSDLLRLDPASGQLEPLVVGSRARGGAGVVHENAQFTPDGRFILFDSDRSGVYALYAYEPASGRTFQVARTLTGLFDPTLVRDDVGPSLVAMEYTSRGYRLSRLPYDPSRWQPVDPAAPRVAVSLSPAALSSDPTGDASARPASRAASAAGAESVQGEVRPYSPWSSLRPRFWLPLMGMDEAGPQPGALTFGYDAYQEHAYTLMAGYGITSGRPTFLADYAGPLWGSRQAFWGIGGGQQTLLDPDGTQGTVRRDLYLDAGYSWPGIVAATSFSARAEIWEEQPVSSGGAPGPMEPGQALTVGVNRLRTWPVDARSFDLESGLTMTGLRTGAGWNRQGVLATLREKAALRWNLGRQSVDADLALGTSTLSDGFTVGASSDWLRGTDGAWTLNAAGPALEGRHAARFTVGLNGQLLRITRGMGTSQLFFDDVGGRLYLEGGAAWASLDGAPQARYGIGAETSLTAYVQYAIPLTLSVGVAVPVNTPDASTSVYLRLDVSDLLGAAGRLLQGTRPGGPSILGASPQGR
ncbi:TolB family protein [Limnochorda pilosa]|uniref:Uncharacterized protein n=1 Tax=Limnochorda pilosa TaxID=1555112 RepID=A0A0K2SNT1_LIMPI|nr:PD40 domain-containing protein [Limnochorda pilosa]BAS28647.1 hypothetical protein LIP_2818 [Limnochorda pilosa]